MFSCEICKNFKNTYFEKHLGTIASLTSFFFNNRISAKLNDWLIRLPIHWLQGAEFLEDWVGLRPVRSSMRVDREDMKYGINNERVAKVWITFFAATVSEELLSLFFSLFFVSLRLIVDFEKIMRRCDLIIQFPWQASAIFTSLIFCEARVRVRIHLVHTQNFTKS